MRRPHRSLDEVTLAACGVVCADLVLAPVDAMPTANGLSLAGIADFRIGGPAAAALLCAANLGADARLVGPLSQDRLGRTIERMLYLDGIDTQSTWRVGASSSASAVLINSNGDRAIIHATGANATLTETDFRYGFLDGAHGLLWAGPGITPGLHGEPGALLLQKARGLGLKTAVDTVHPGPVSPGGALWMLEPALQYADFVFISMREAEMYVNRTDAEEVGKFLIERGAKTVFVKMSAKGMLVVEAKKSPVHVPGFKVTTRDTTNAGDSTVGATFLRLLQGDDPVTAACFGAMVGAIVVSKGEGAHGVPDEAEVLRHAAEAGWMGKC